MPKSASLKRIEEDFPRFIEAVREKLKRGAEQYGDSSFDMDAKELIGELKQETIDIAGWGWILYERLNRLEKELSGK